MKFNFKNSVSTVKKGMYDNAPLILAICGAAGSVTALYMAFKTAPKAKEILEQLDIPEDATKTQILWEKTKAVAPIVAAPLILETASLACMFGSYKSSSKRLATLGTAYAISESRFREYQRRVVEELGKTKEEKIRAKAMKDKMDGTEKPKEVEKDFEDGKYWCYDGMSGRWFRSTRQEIEDARNELNRRLIDENYVSLNDLYDEIDDSRLATSELGEEFGWNADNCKIDFKFYPLTDRSGNPALGIDFYVRPRFDFRRLY